MPNSLFFSFPIRIERAGSAEEQPTEVGCSGRRAHLAEEAAGRAQSNAGRNRSHPEEAGGRHRGARTATAERHEASAAAEPAGQRCEREQRCRDRTKGSTSRRTEKQAGRAREGEAGHRYRAKPDERGDQKGAVRTGPIAEDHERIGRGEVHAEQAGAGATERATELAATATTANAISAATAAAAEAA